MRNTCVRHEVVVHGRKLELVLNIYHNEVLRSVMAVMAKLGNTTSSLSVGSPVVRWFEAFPSRKFGARFDLRGVSRGSMSSHKRCTYVRPGRQLRSLVYRPN